MKKIIIFLIVIVFLFSACLLGQKKILLDSFETETISIFISEGDYSKYEHIDHKFCVQIFAKNEDYQTIKNTFELLGESFVLNDLNCCVNRVVEELGVFVKKRQYIQNYEIIYGFSKQINYETVDGCNVQIALNNNKIVVGVPIIIGEF